MVKQLQVFLVFFIGLGVYAQQDTLVQLQEVTVADRQLKKFSGSQKLIVLSDSIIAKSKGSLTDLLRNNSSIYFKENGFGMVSSPSFRGTTASQTAVVWNGININSQFNGQTDFNTINATDFDNVTIRPGGGSVTYGSGAIGGTVHLNNEMKFKTASVHAVRVNYGSFSTYGIRYGGVFSTQKFSSTIHFSRNESQNDYKYIGYDKKNENGFYQNNSFNTVFGYKLNGHNTLKLYTHYFDGERYFSGTISSPSKSKYLDLNMRNMVEWQMKSGRFTSQLKGAFLQENYKYYENRMSENFTHGTVESTIFKYDVIFEPSRKVRWNVILDYTQNNGRGSGIAKAKREIAGGSLLFQHKIAKTFQYEGSFRYEATSVYKSPLLFSLGGKWDVTTFYAIKINGSKNYRIPTFNDLYWQGSGNPNLKPEHSYQAELSQILSFSKFKFTATGYYYDITDMLRWVPNASGIWTPENTDKVSTYGAELGTEWQKKLGQTKLSFNLNYAYTVSENEQTRKQLIYVPFHKINGQVNVGYRRASLYYQFLFNGKVYTSNDNFYDLESYWLSNAGLQYDLGKKKNINVLFQVFNLENKAYQNVLSRPMPGRNYNLSINFKL
ncbi:TonB-dependent receptor [Flavobacterium sp. NRK F10]|uniref:TonB-dependent receptor plug domain-containing protein n=1 Tax=Flavobacterium sp. NRK F10 TaxID=2954931 RepID=UPI0020908E5E|nr:TonB-dependent receptor [Flavobacterium sp. NRK F10]MCO6173960.1 TonB-dependent receptor [Flavobacterium sp. NRK F10]